MNSERSDGSKKGRREGRTGDEGEHGANDEQAPCGAADAEEADCCGNAERSAASEGAAGGADTEEDVDEEFETGKYSGSRNGSSRKKDEGGGEGGVRVENGSEGECRCIVAPATAPARRSFSTALGFPLVATAEFGAAAAVLLTE